MDLLILISLCALCIAGAVYYDRQIARFRKAGRRLDARIVSYEKLRTRRDSPRAPWITYHIFTVEYDGPGAPFPVTARLMTDSRRAAKYARRETLPIAVSAAEVRFLHDVPAAPGKYFLLTMGGVFFLSALMSAAGYIAG